jgi:hypothetical protein
MSGNDSQVPARIFLSHKSVDKEVVRDYKQTLELIGLRPWLDDDDMTAGAQLHREIQKGMKESCSAVFFITPDFKDEKHLGNEINYAIAEKTQRGDAFSIITLVFEVGGKTGRVPELLEPYVWKTPKTPLQGLREIIRALPAPFRDIRPVAELTAEPKVKVTASAGQLVTEAPRPTSEDVILVRIENHGNQSLYLSGAVAFDRDDAEGHYMIKRDANGTYPTKRELRPGDGFTIPVSASIFGDYARHITRFFFQDELGRMFAAPEAETRAALKDVKTPEGKGGGYKSHGPLNVDFAYPA